MAFVNIQVGIEQVSWDVKGSNLSVASVFLFKGNSEGIDNHITKKLHKNMVGGLVFFKS